MARSDQSLLLIIVLLLLIRIKFMHPVGEVNSQSAGHQDIQPKALVQKANHQPLQMLQSGQLLSIANLSGTGLILRKAFHCEFVGPGAAVGGMFDTGCTSVYAVGKVQFLVPATTIDRKQAFQARIAYLERLQEITVAEAPLRRALSALEYLGDVLGVDVVQQIPDEMMAGLVGVFIETMAIARQQVGSVTVVAEQQILNVLS
jgi:hypothetical protein